MVTVYPPRISALALAAAIAAAPLSGQTIAFDNSTPYDAVPGLTSYQTNFSELGPMLVEWSFVGGGGGSATWGYLGDYLGFIDVYGVLSDGFFLGGVAGLDTYNSPWHLIGQNVSSFTIYASLGNSVFDVIPSPETTSGSSQGQEFNYQCSGVFVFIPFCYLGGDDYWNTTVTYSNPVGINGADPQGDLYATMTVSFGNGFNTGGGCGWGWTGFDADGCNYVTFLQDMDNGPADGSIGIPQETVPEPATMTLLATGLAGMAAARRRRNNC
jgi:hypothetical protein